MGYHWENNAIVPTFSFRDTRVRNFALGKNHIKQIAPNLFQEEVNLQQIPEKFKFKGILKNSRSMVKGNCEEIADPVET